MIKNDNQFQRSKTRLQEIRVEIQKVEEEYSGLDLDFWAGYLYDEEQKLVNELHEYEILRQMSLEEYIDSPLNEPVLLENISELLAKIRIAANYTQGEMSKKLGWQQSNLSRFENENYSSQTIAKIAEFVGVLGVNLYVIPSFSDTLDNITYKGTPPARKPVNIPDTFSTGYQTGVYSEKEINTQISDRFSFTSSDENKCLNYQIETCV